jgi:uncharacterized protein (DUF2267 family)
MTMPSATTDPFAPAVQTAHAWLADIARALGTEDRRYTYRVLRAWLHTLRDRLTVNAAVKLAAQLPELLRGMYYDGWEPSRVPIRYGPDEYAIRFAFEARIPLADVAEVALAVADALARHVSPGQLDETLAQLPAPLRVFVTRGGDPAPVDVAPVELTDADKLLADLEDRIDNLSAAVRALALGFENRPESGVDERRRGQAARVAADILIAGRARTTGTGGPEPAEQGGAQEEGHRGGQRHGDDDVM